MWRRAFDIVAQATIDLTQRTSGRLEIWCVPGLANKCLLPQLDAHSLGALIALYEHKVFAAATLWGINPFDQWGVELGKTIATGILAELEGGQSAARDPSTADLIERVRQVPLPTLEE